MIKQDIKITVDAVVFGYTKQQMQILLVKRKNDPCKDMWALPGGFVEDDEDLEPAAKRELEEETGLKLKEMEQLCTVGTPGRDPRFRTVSVVYYAVIDAAGQKIQAADDAADAQWHNIKNLPEMAFDHEDIIEFAINYMNS